MDSVSYFEIGGEVVETSLPSSSPSASPFRGAPTHSRSPGARASESKESGGRKADHPASPNSVDERDWEKQAAAMIGSGLVRVGVGVLMVPDPLPFVDEIIAISFIGVGSGLILWSQT